MYLDTNNLYGWAMFKKLPVSLHKDLPFLPNKEKINKVEKLVTCIEDKEKYRNTHKCSKTSTRLWINTKKSTQSN